MNTESLLPPLALALGRLRQPRPAALRTWSFTPTLGATHPVTERAPSNDFLLIVAAEPSPSGTQVTELGNGIAAIPGAEAARTYWFDL